VIRWKRSSTDAVVADIEITKEEINSSQIATQAKVQV
jgi:hypothetical protein